MYCPSCGEELPDGSSFCTECGAEIDAEGQPTEAAGSPAQGAAAGEPAPGAAGGQAAPGTAAGTAHQGARGDTAGGLSENVAGALAYVLGFITGLVFLLIEDDNEFVRFHAAQSIVVFGALFVLGFGLSILQGVLSLSGIAFVGWMLAAILGLSSLLLSLAGFVAWIVLMVKAYNGEEYELPLAGGFARNLAS